MSGYTVNTSVGRVTGGEQDTLWYPRNPRAGKYGLILLHGAGNPHAYVDVVNQPSSVRLAAALAGLGIPAVACDFGGDSWANPASMTAVTNAWNLLKTTFPQMGVSKVCLLGGSMGAALAARYSQLHPSDVAAVVGLIPAYDVKYQYVNVGGFAASIEAAWGFSGVGNFPATLDLAANAGLATSVPILSGYASNDTTVPPAPAIAYHNAVGGLPQNLVNLGAVGHTDAAIGAMPISQVAQFLVANGA